jgi:hypothetical protein
VKTAFEVSAAAAKAAVRTEMGQASRAEALAAEDDRPTDGERSFVLIRFKCVANTTFDKCGQKLQDQLPREVDLPRSNQIQKSFVRYSCREVRIASKQLLEHLGRPMGNG